MSVKYNIYLILLETPHVIVAAAIASKINNPLLAITLSLASHFVLEKVPHWNPHLNTEKKLYGGLTAKTKKIIAVDVMISLISGFLISARALPDYGLAATILASCFFGVLPDIVEGPYFLLNWKSKLIEKWVRLQKVIQTDAEPVPGLISQVLTIFAAIWWIFR